MTNLNPKKTNAPETIELHDEKLAQVTGGNTLVTNGGIAVHKYICEHCGTESERCGVPCPVCGKTVKGPLGAMVEG